MTNQLNPAVTTIIPTFRRPRELDDAVRSVLAQEVALEVWVVDDSPEQSARAVIEPIAAVDPRVHYEAMPTPTGGRPALVRNLGLSRARASLVHFLDDDDVLPRGHYRRAVAAFERDASLGALFGRVEPFGADETQLGHERSFFASAARHARHLHKLAGRFALAAAQSFQSTLLVCSAGMIRTECVRAVGGFDPRLPLMEDIDLYARLFQRFPSAFEERISIHYRIGPSLMHGNPVDEKAKESYRLMHARYREELGSARFLALKILARSVFR